MKPPTKTRQTIKLKQNQKFTNNAEGNVFQMRIFWKNETDFHRAADRPEKAFYVAMKWEIYWMIFFQAGSRNFKNFSID